MFQLRRWLHLLSLVVGDNGYAVIDLLHFWQSLHETRNPHHQTAPGC